MPDMTPARHTKARTPGLGAAWAVLIGTLSASVTYNVVHATQGARLEVVLALLLGFAPAFVAACLSHVAAVLDAPAWVKAAVIAVMGAGMVLSASATAAVVAPADPGWRGWLFGCTLDAAALLALWAILTARGRKNEAAKAVSAAHAEAAQAAGERSRLAEELASVRAESAQRLEAVSAELDAARSAHTALLERTAVSAQRRRKPPRKSAQAEDFGTEFRALNLLQEEPSLREPRMGAELARRLGVSPATGRRLHARLTAQDRPADPLSERSAESPDARSDERS